MAKSIPQAVQWCQKHGATKFCKVLSDATENILKIVLLCFFLHLFGDLIREFYVVFHNS